MTNTRYPRHHSQTGAQKGRVTLLTAVGYHHSLITSISSMGGVLRQCLHVWMADPSPRPPISPSEQIGNSKQFSEGGIVAASAVVRL